MHETAVGFFQAREIVPHERSVEMKGEFDERVPVISFKERNAFLGTVRFETYELFSAFHADLFGDDDILPLCLEEIDAFIGVFIKRILQERTRVVRIPDRLPLVQMSESNVAVFGEYRCGNGSYSAEVDVPFAVTDLSARDEKVGHDDVRHVPPVCLVPLCDPAGDALRIAFVRLFLFEPRFVGIGKDIDVDLLPRGIFDDKISLPRFHSADGTVSPDFGKKGLPAVNIDAVTLGKGRRGREADAVVVVSADDDDRTRFPRKLLDGTEKQLLRFRRGKKGIKDVPRDEDEVDVLFLADLRKEIKRSRLFGEPFPLEDPLSEVPIGCVQNSHKFGKKKNFQPAGKRHCLSAQFMIYYYTSSLGKKQAFREKTEEREEEMSFCTYSGEITANMFTSVENQFIVKYLPQADGDAVRVYLYGLYLCQCAQDFDAESAAKLLKISVEKLKEIFAFWEECDLVQILSKDPLFVQYLPVNNAVGKPKAFRPEKYADFNRAFYKILQKAGKDFKPYEMQRIFEFLEKQPMEQQAFLLVAEYCARKSGSGLSCNHILNKAQNLCAEHIYTYEQAESYFSDFNVHEKDLSHIFTLLGIYKKPREEDYVYLEKWLSRGAELKAVFAAAEYLKKGTLQTLDVIMEELSEKEALSEESAKEYLVRRAEVTDVVFKIARKLGVKVQNPRPYADEYCEKWLERGYDPESLSLLASVFLRLSYGFAEMDAALDGLYRDGIVDEQGVKSYCAARDKEMKLFQRIQSECGVIKKTQSALDMIAAWRGWNFSDEMIVEAAKRSANASHPLSYMNKLLSEWKRAGAFSVSEIPEKTEKPSPAYKSEAAIAADKRTEREQFYAARRQRAIEVAEAAKRKAEEDDAFNRAEAACRKGEIELARAEVYSPEKAQSLREQLERSKKARADALARLGLSDPDLAPKFVCTKCSDTGFLPNGKACDCYKIQ